MIVALPITTIREVKAVWRALAKNSNVIALGGLFMRYWDPITMFALFFTAVLTPAEIPFGIWTRGEEACTTRRRA